SGYLETYVFPALYSLKPYYLPLSFSLIFVLALLFSHSFLGVRTWIPRLHRLIITMLAVWGALIVLIPFTNYVTLAPFMVPWGVLSLVVLLAAGIISWRHGLRSARFYVIAWFGFVITLLIVMLVRLGVVSSTGFSENAYHVGVMWMAVCWSIALSDRINLLKAETESANRDLQSSQHRLAQILEGLPLGVVVYGKDQKPSYINRRVTEILGNPSQGIVPDLSAGRTLAQAMNYFSLVPTGTDQILPIEDMPVYRALQGEPASTDDIEADLVDRRVPLEIWASPVRDDAGDVESAVVAFQDITARKRAELALRASEQHFRVIVENNFDGIIFMNRDRKLLYVSPSYEQLNGMKAEELIGQSGAGFVHPDDQVRVAATFGEVLQQPGRRVTEEYRIRHQDGSWVWLETNVINLLDDPHVQAVVLNSRDITERKQTEAELADYRMRLEWLVEERTEELSATNDRLSDEIVERQTLERLLHQNIEWLTTLNLVRQTIGGAADLAQACERLSAKILQLFDAKDVFLLNWGDPGAQLKFFSLSPQDVSPIDLDRMKTSFQIDSLLHGDIELGKSLVLSADQAASLPAPLGTYFQEDGCRSLVLVPLVARQSVSGVMGVVMPPSTQDFTPAQVELIATMAHDLADLTEDAQLLDQVQALVAAEERNRLARDLHDSVTQVLFSASLVAEVLPQIWRRDPERALQSLEELRRLTRSALAEMRTMLLELRPASVFKTPLPELLAQLTEAITGRADLPFQLLLEQVPSLPEEVHTTFYRIAQEALNNVLKHAQATKVIVSLSVAPLTPDPGGGARHELKLVVDDDGVGFDRGIGRQEHLGTGIMQERADAIKATLSVDSRLGHGTRVTLIWHSASENAS
ncbi:MAG: PAS domain S-box protein, partial [Candidatus Promineifilaceae bacterium]